MKLCLNALLITVLLFFSAATRATIGLSDHHDSITLGKKFTKRYPRILIDARGSRGGNGDIAAAYLTLTDWITNYEIKSSVTVLVDENGGRRLAALAEGNKRFLDQVTIREASAGPMPEPFSLYLVFANPSGTYRYKNDFGSLFRFTSDATLIVQTVLGNTENQKSNHPFATVESAGRIFDWGPAGPGEKESGIYSDTVASELRPLDLGQTRKYILAHLHEIKDDFSRDAVSLVLNNERLVDAKVGLVYGISAEQTQKQFVSYLRGLSSNSESSYVLFTPSAFRAGDVRDTELENKLTFITSLEALPAHPEKGRIYIIETKTLPHRIFVGLMALSMKSKVVPVGAGDGFLSAAIELGEPFVLTQVPWNRANIARIKDLLISLALRHNIAAADFVSLKSLLLKNFGAVDFKTASALARFAPLFRLLRNEIPRLSDRIIDVALSAGQLTDSAKVPAVNDFYLQRSVLSGGYAGNATLPLTCRSLF